MSRIALVWNFEDNNFTWMDASVVVDAALADVRCMHYGFDPGWLATWEHMNAVPYTWEDLQNGTDFWGDGTNPTKWSDLYEAGKDQNMYWLTDTYVWKADQVVDTSGVKKYYVERTGIDFNDVGISTNDAYKHVKQIYPLLQTTSDVGAMNTYDFKIGWSNNLMDDPDYDDAVTLNLNKTQYSGKHKIDLRSTGRYMAWYWDFTYTDEIAMTSADVNLEVAHGR